MSFLRTARALRSGRVVPYSALPKRRCGSALRTPGAARGFSTVAAATSSTGVTATTPPALPPNVTRQPDGSIRTLLYDGEEEILTAAQHEEKQRLIKELTRRLSGPLADEHGNVPTGKDRPIAIEVDGPSHFYANSQRYTAYSKLKHRLLTRMGYKVLHVPYFDWRRLRGAKEREDYMRQKLKEEPTEWLDPEDAKYYEQRTSGSGSTASA